MRKLIIVASLLIVSAFLIPTSAFAGIVMVQETNRVDDGAGGHTSTEINRQTGEVFREVTVEGDIDGNGTSKRTEYDPNKNVTTVKLENESGHKTTTSTYHDEGLTITNEELPDGTRIQTRDSLEDGVTTKVFAASGREYTGEDLELVEGTPYQMWEFKEAVAAGANATPRQIEIIRAVTGLEEPKDDGDGNGPDITRNANPTIDTGQGDAGGGGNGAGPGDHTIDQEDAIDLVEDEDE